MQLRIVRSGPRACLVLGSLCLLLLGMVALPAAAASTVNVSPSSTSPGSSISVSGRDLDDSCDNDDSVIVLLVAEGDSVDLSSAQRVVRATSGRVWKVFSPDDESWRGTLTLPSGITPGTYRVHGICVDENYEDIEDRHAPGTVRVLAPPPPTTTTSPTTRPPTTTSPTTRPPATTSPTTRPFSPTTPSVIDLSEFPDLLNPPDFDTSDQEKELDKVLNDLDDNLDALASSTTDPDKERGNSVGRRSGTKDTLSNDPPTGAIDEELGSITVKPPLSPPGSEVRLSGKSCSGSHVLALLEPVAGQRPIAQAHITVVNDAWEGGLVIPADAPRGPYDVVVFCSDTEGRGTHSYRPRTLLVAEAPSGSESAGLFDLPTPGSGDKPPFSFFNRDTRSVLIGLSLLGLGGGFLGLDRSRRRSRETNLPT